MAETRITPYVKYGDWLLKLGALFSLIILLIVYAVLPFQKYIFKKKQPLNPDIVIVNRNEE